MFKIKPTRCILKFNFKQNSHGPDVMIQARLGTFTQIIQCNNNYFKIQVFFVHVDKFYYKYFKVM